MFNLVDGIPEEDFNDPDDVELEDDFFYEDDLNMLYDGDVCYGKKVRHCSGINGVVTAVSSGYYFVTHSGGQESFIHSGELYGGKEPPTATEMEEYLGHPNGLPPKEKVEAKVSSG